MARLRTISPQKADALVRTGAWITEEQLTEALHDVIQQNVDALAAVGALAVAPVRAKAAWDVLLPVLGEVADYHPVSGPEVGPASTARIVEGRVFKVAPAARAAVLAGCSVVAALLSAPIGSLLFAASLAPALDAARQFVRAYERLEGTERDVVEAVADLARRLSIVNHDALRGKDYGAAFGMVNPTAADVAELVGLPEVEVRQTLRELERREIVSERNGRWGIAL